MVKIAALAGALLVLGACTGEFGDRVQEQSHQSVGVSGTPTVHVENVAGAIRIIAWNKPAVDVRATKYGYDADELRSISIAVHTESNNVFIITKYAGGTHEGGVRYAISVPANASIDAKNIAGLVEVSGVQGNVAVETQAGEITADLGTVAGNRSIDLRATTGAIRLSLARESSASVEATSTVGAFSSDFPQISQSRENVVGSKASGKIGSGSAAIRLSTTTGTISLRE
jgi:DUF4097 and DUF4098 domain-containing protein YvlB